MNALIPRATIEQIVAHRDATLAKFDDAFDHIAAADAVIKEAHELWGLASGGHSGSDGGREEQEFWNAVKLPDRDVYQRSAERLVDSSVWTHIIEMTRLRSLMDRQAREQLDAQMRARHRRYVGTAVATGDEDREDLGFPPITVENIHATIERFASEADIIWRRGIANAFSGLDRRFRSHDGFKIGSRVIINRLADDDGWIFFSGYKHNEIEDIERAFRVLDNDPTEGGTIIDQIRMERGRPHHPRGRHQSEHEGRYFRVRIFKNGNAHLWFTRDDLVEKVNKVLAEWYGEVIGDGQTKDDPLRDIKTTPAKRHGFYPSSSDVADRVIGAAALPYNDTLSVLEPSAGTGSLARVSIKNGNHVTCVEVQGELARKLTEEGIYRAVHHADFLELRPAAIGTFDRVVMNPPFDRERDIDHVIHAMNFLKPNGILVAVMSAGTEFRETRKALAFRGLMTQLNAQWRDLPAGSFSEVGTNVNTLIVRFRKNGGDIPGYL